MSETHAQTVAYVRETMLPQQEPPLAQSGTVRWMRENLLSSPLNILLTIASIWVVYLSLAALVPWVLNSVWDARSLSECRQVFLVTGASGGGGACWAVLQERGIQLIYGFYPADLYWRPNLTFLLFFVAIAPVLYPGLPRQMLWFTGVYPFLMPWLLWGGSFWLPLLVIAGLVVGYLVWRVLGAVNGLLAAVAAMLAALVWWLAVVPALNNGLHRLSTESRTVGITAEAGDLIERLRPRLAELEAEREALRAEVSALEAIKAEAYAPIVEAVEAARAAAILAFFEERGLDPESEEIGPTLREDARHEARAAASAATEDPALADERATFLAAVDQLTTLRNGINALSSQITLMTADISNAESRLANLAAMPERQASLSELSGVEAERAALVPRALRDLPRVDAAPAGTDPADLEALRALLEVRGQMTTLTNALDSTYKDAGRIGLEPVQDREFGGFMLALIIGLSGIILSLPLGILLALGRQSDLFIIKAICVGFIEVIRGVPLIVWLFTAQLLLNYFLPPGTNFSLLLRVIIMVTFFASAYIAEVVRGGLAALPRGQYEAAGALGLDYGKAMRLIILPQALKVSIPGIVNTFIGLFKDTTLVVFIGLLDPIGLSETIRASTDWQGIYWELFVFVGLMFFACCYGMSRYSLALERKLSREHR